MKKICWEVESLSVLTSLDTLFTKHLCDLLEFSIQLVPYSTYGEFANEFG